MSIPVRAKAAARSAAPWLVGLARVGYVAKGVLYLAIAALAMRLAAGTPVGKPDAKVAMDWLGKGPWGEGLLGVAAVGLIGYALWKLAAAVAGSHAKATTRLGAAVGGFVHLGLGALAAFRLAGRPMPAGGGGGGDPAITLSGRLFAMPGGDWIVMAAGAGFVGFGLWQLVRAFRGDAARGVDLRGFTPDQRGAVERMGAAGFAARGVAFGMIGAFLIQAAMQRAPQRARGFGGAITGLIALPHGRTLIAAVALAFAAYGLFMFVKARGPRLDPLAAGD